uniref:neuropeptide Y receptor type 1-like n=1 Tax=Myxine glutinosa TaxID=7769 RepID=UPI00358E7966
MYFSKNFTFHLLNVEPCYPPHSVITFLITAYIVVIIGGLIGNTVLVLVIAHQKELQNVTNVLIANLACSDILVCLICLPLTVAYTLMDHWAFGEVLCKTSPFLQCSTVSVSIFSLVLIAIERHQLIIHPTGWKPSLAHAHWAIALIWLLAFLISLPYAVFQMLTNAPYENLTLFFPDLIDKVACVESWPSNTYKVACGTLMLLFQYCFPLLFIFLCYQRIFLRLKRRARLLPSSANGRGRATHSKKINLMLVAIVAGFAILWLPLYVFNAISDWNHEVLLNCQNNLIFSLCHLTAMLSTCINPIFYGFLNNNFQKELRATISRCQCKRAEEDLENFPLSTMNTDVSKGSVRFSLKTNVM